MASQGEYPVLKILVSAVTAFGLGFGAYDTILRITDKDKVEKGTYVLNTELTEGAARGREHWLRATPPTSCRLASLRTTLRVLVPSKRLICSLTEPLVGSRGGYR